MSSPRFHKTLDRACEGEHLAIWGLAGHEQLDVVLAEILAEREVRGARVPVVSLLMRGHEDADWIREAVAWLAARGRRVVVRTRVVMPRDLVSVLAQARSSGAGAIVELELAHHKAAIQRALLGEHADTVAALLLQAQHLETLEIPVVARLAPLLPGIHDQAGGFAPLLRAVEAAALRRVVLDVGRLHPQQIGNLVAVARELSVAGLLELARAFAVDPMVLLAGAELPPAQAQQVFKLKPRRAQVLAHGLETMAREAGLEIPACPGTGNGSCRAYCELAEAGGSNRYQVGYESVMGRDLFAGLEVG